MVNSGVLSEDRANSGVWRDLGQLLGAYRLFLYKSALKSAVSLLTGFRISWFSSDGLRNSCFDGEAIYCYVSMALECNANVQVAEPVCARKISGHKIRAVVEYIELQFGFVRKKMVK